MVFFMVGALGALAASSSFDTSNAVRLCRPALAVKAGGEIQTITATSMRKSGRSSIVTGRLTAFIGMGSPQPGSASAHHLIRADFDFRCRINGRNVGKTTVTPHQ